MKKMLGLVLAVVMVLSIGGFALGWGQAPQFSDPKYQGVNEENLKQSVLFTVYTVVNLPCFLEVTLEGNELGRTETSIGNQYIEHDTLYQDGWYMTFFEGSDTTEVDHAGTPITKPADDKWLNDCGQVLKPIWNITIKATDTWRLYILGGDLANESGDKIRIQYSVSANGSSYSSYTYMSGGGEAMSGSNGQFGPQAIETFATMNAKWIATHGPTAGTTYWFKYRFPHKWTTPQGYYEGITGYLVASYE